MLSGELSCIRCGYALQGLSVREACPECGTPVVATVLSAVDPLASELQPVARPRVIAIGLFGMVGLALASVLVVGMARGMELLETVGVGLGRPAWMALASVVLLVGSAMLSLVVVSPHRGISTWRRALAAGGVVLLAVSAGLHSLVQLRLDMALGSGMFDQSGMADERIMFRGLGAVLAGAAVLMVRPNVRELLARSVVLRTGRRARQPLMPIAMALFVIAGVDAATLIARGLVGGIDHVVETVAVFAVGLSGVMVVIGLIGLLWDLRRLAPVLAKPGPTAGEVLTDGG